MARYQRIADALREQINDGLLTPGDQLPTEPNLAAEHTASRMTVRQALDVLLAEGLIEKRHGRGTFVRRPVKRITYVSACGERERKARAADSDEETYVRPGSVAADVSLSAFMGVELGAELVEYRYFSRRENLPYYLARIYVPRDLADLLDAPTAQYPWGDEIALGLAAAGIHLTHVTERIRTRPPRQDEADRLGLPSGATVLAIERTSADEEGRVCVGARLVAPGDRVEVVCTRAAGDLDDGGEPA